MSRQIELPLSSSDPHGSPPESGRALADVHSHLVPAVDDGARDVVEAVAAIDRLAAAGVRYVLTTPHIDASVIIRQEAFARLQRVAEVAWRTVVERSRERHPGIALHLGREVMLDTAVPDLDDPRVRLNGGRYVLVEFPRLNIPEGSEDVLYHIVARGWVPVVAHVERYFYQGPEVDILTEWRAAGAVFQVNVASLLGKYGPRARALAWELLIRGDVHLLASDYHARGETWIPEAWAELTKEGGEDQARLLLGTNPRRIVRDEPLEDVPPLALRRGKGRWSLRRILGGGA
jgi:protein-tyrosine phosphatase